MRLHLTDSQLNSILRTMPTPTPDADFEERILRHALETTPQPTAINTYFWHAAACLMLFCIGYAIGDMFTGVDNAGTIAKADTFTAADDAWDTI